MLKGHFKRWRIAEPDAQAGALAEAAGLSSLLGQVLLQRGLRSADEVRRFLDPSLGDLYDPAGLPGVVRAAERIVQAVRDGQRIVIYGDYDVDGITATSILYHTLKTAAPDADVGRYVPHRIDEGYGINTEAIAHLADGGAQLIVSVDCGITATEPAEEAKRRNVDLIITDHHQRSEQLPDAHTIVHPQLEPEGAPPYAFDELSGAGVAYKLAWQIARTWCGSERVSDVFRKLLVDLLSLAALGTVADVVRLVDENRIIARHGLGRIKNTSFTGLNALIDVASLGGEKIDAYHVGFVLGPRLNACGRMGHAKEAVRLLTDAPADEARQIAAFLDDENDKRRNTERTITKQATEMVHAAGYDRDDVRIIVMGHENWHAGVVGIVCSRLVDRFGRPAVLLNTANDQAHGSARSISGFDMHAALGACAEHLSSYGGHAMAAGLRLPVEKLDAFRQQMMDYAAAKLTVDDLTPHLDIDAEAALRDLTVGAVEQLNRLAPFGRGNPRPMFLVRNVKLAQPAQTVGRDARHLVLTLQSDRAMMRSIGWQMGKLAERLPAGTQLDIACQPKLNHYNGRTTVEPEIVDLRWPHRDEPDITVHASVRANIST